MLFVGPNRYCSATIESNTDIGGPGIIISFTILAWLTIIVCGITQLFYSYERRAEGTWRPSRAYDLVLRQLQPLLGRLSGAELRRLLDFLDGRVEDLCDMQIITSLAVIIAGWSQNSTISQYHANVVLCLWGLTLNSFFASRAQFLGLNFDSWEVSRTSMNVVRRLAIIVSLILSLIFAIEFVILFWTEWDNEVGPCFNYAYGTTPFMFAVLQLGIVVFALTLAFSLSWKTIPWLEKAQKANERGYQALKSLWKTPLAADIVRNDVVKMVLIICERAAIAVAIALYVVISMWATVFSLGNGLYGTQWLIYFALNVVNTVELMIIWQWNTHLVEDEETKWGFGQVLPLTMIFLVLFPFLRIHTHVKGDGTSEEDCQSLLGSNGATSLRQPDPSDGRDSAQDPDLEVDQTYEQVERGLILRRTGHWAF